MNGNNGRSVIVSVLMYVLWSLVIVDAILAQGKVSFLARQDFPVGAGPRSVAVGDFNDDGLQDLASVNGEPSTVSILLGLGDGTFQAAQDFGVGAFPQSVAVGDFNGDGLQDLATANFEPGEEPTTGTVSILLGRGDGTFQAAQDFGVGVAAEPFSIAVGDFNGDGLQDLATANGGANNVSILLGRGDGTFEAAQDFEVGAFPQSVSVGDFNGDGQPDLATTNFFDATISILVNDTFGVIVNELVTFDLIRSTLTFRPDPNGCPGGFEGIYSFEARLTNVSERSLADLIVAVTTLTDGNLLQNADGGPGGVGAHLTVPRQHGFTDAVLSPDEFVDVPFVICVTERRHFTFEVDVLGAVE